MVVPLYSVCTYEMPFLQDDGATRDLIHDMKCERRHSEYTSTSVKDSVSVG